jgi:hypothetical protein
MDQYKQAIVMMAIIDIQWTPHDIQGRRRVMTADELDAIADFGWHWDFCKEFMGRATAVLSRWRPRASDRVDGARLLTASEPEF